LKRAARLFIGEHDFAAFTANCGKKERNTVRTIDYVRIRDRRNLIEIEFSADGFLYKMVRLMVGSIARCALGKESLQSVEVRLERPSGAAARFVAPAAGLYLIRVSY
jgi:tRNA pseudouridine38-40 synthase